ncbi:TPA: replication endonuclease [Vibrio parahaemolyticus]|uniref:replication endonuclease n=1 Tax=Vibrio parahaemolyticus TaxID=670 RepID=UPI00041FFE95|nr:replication endonuclease [Vibrio parahaemolyticus]EHH3732196.1 replication endonuclease [Vibrio parahaemolyticus]
MTINSYHLFFSKQSYIEFFYFEYDKKSSHEAKLEEFYNTKYCLSVLGYNGLSLQKDIIKYENKLQKVNSTALLRFQSKKYMRRKFVQFILSEMLYDAQRKKKLGCKTNNSYATKRMTKYRQMQREHNAKFLAKKAISVNKKLVTLNNFANNAQKKVCELYSKVKGMQEYAEELGYDWAFVTITAPAFYHPNPVKGRFSWSGENAKKAQQYFLEKWSAFGKDIAKKGYPMKEGTMFGLRVVELHQDGCPHWHIVVFYDPCLASDNLIKLVDNDGIFAKHFASDSAYALKIVKGKRIFDGESRQAVASAASYSFKYILKAVGADILDDFSTNSTIEDTKNIEAGIEKIEAWKAALNIRSYQTFGFSGSSSSWNATRKIAKQTGHLSSETIDNKLIYSFNRLPINQLTLTDELDSLLTSSEMFDLNMSQLDSVENHDASISIASEAVCVDTHEALLKDLSESLSMHIELNGHLNDIDSLSKENEMLTIIQHSVHNNYCEFIKACKEYSIEIIYQTYENEYNETKKKAIGINAGSQVYLFEKYDIIEVTPILPKNKHI